MGYSLKDLQALYELPFQKLLEKAHATHKEHHVENQVQLCVGLSVKTGGCPEDCKFCQQSAHYKTAVTPQPLMSATAVDAFAKRAFQAGATRLCLGAAWRKIPIGETFEQVLELIKVTRNIGLEVCCSMGTVSYEQAVQMKKAGCLEYNHNLDSSRKFYPKIITTRTYEERLKTIDDIFKSGLRLSCCGIVGMGEEISDRIELLWEVYNLKQTPETLPINALVSCAGTPLEGRSPMDPFEFVKFVSLARIMFPKAILSLAGGRVNFDYPTQALCFYAGANAFYLGSKILTTPNNPDMDKDYQMIKSLGLKPLKA